MTTASSEQTRLRRPGIIKGQSPCSTVARHLVAGRQIDKSIETFHRASATPSTEQPLQCPPPEQNDSYLSMPIKDGLPGKSRSRRTKGKTKWYPKLSHLKALFPSFLPLQEPRNKATQPRSLVPAQRQRAGGRSLSKSSPDPSIRFPRRGKQSHKASDSQTMVRILRQTKAGLGRYAVIMGEKERKKKLLKSL